MRETFTITQAEKSHTVKTYDEIIEIVDNLSQVDPFIIEHNVVTDVTESLIETLKAKISMEEIRRKNRLHYHKFSTDYLDEDWPLISSFDLFFDIKTEGHLAYVLKKEGPFSEDLMNMCLKNGLTMSYLSNLNLKIGD